MRQHPWEPSQCFVLIKQSDSPPCQFGAERYGYEPTRCLLVVFSWIFKVQGKDPDTAATAVLFAFKTLSPCYSFPRNTNVYTEKKTLPGSPDGVSNSFWVTPTNTLTSARMECGSPAGFRNRNRIPFRMMVVLSVWSIIIF